MTLRDTFEKIGVPKRLLEDPLKFLGGDVNDIVPKKIAIIEVTFNGDSPETHVKSSSLNVRYDLLSDILDDVVFRMVQTESKEL